jgi:hypothetical protein
VAVRGGGGGGGVRIGATTAVVAFAVVVSPSPAPQLSQVVVIDHWRWWLSTPRGGAAHRRRGATRQGGGIEEGGWVAGGRPLGFGSSRSKKKNLSYDYHVGERCAAEYWIIVLYSLDTYL